MREVFNGRASFPVNRTEPPGLMELSAPLPPQEATRRRSGGGGGGDKTEGRLMSSAPV